MSNAQQGKGFASASLLAIVKYGATLGATEMFAGVNRGNAASRRVLEKCGFVEVANLGSYTRFHRRINPSG